MLGVMRQAPVDELAPPKGLTGIPSLVDGIRQSGLPLELACDPPDLLADDGTPSDAAGLAAYRIVQEALTNVVRHAGTVPTRVRLDGSAQGLGVLVENDEPVTAPARGPSSGRGIIGMRERAQALGGTFEAGPCARRRLPGVSARSSSGGERVTVTPVRILVAEDQQLVREGIVTMLGVRDDFEVVAEVGDGSAAVREALRTRPDIALLDIRMPSLDGIEATRQIVAELAAHQGPDADDLRW